MIKENANKEKIGASPIIICLYHFYRLLQKNLFFLMEHPVSLVYFDLAFLQQYFDPDITHVTQQREERPVGAASSPPLSAPKEAAA